MEQGQSRLCPRCGTPRIGNFRWCRSCQFDFDAGRVAAETGSRPFELSPPGQITQAPHVVQAPGVAPPATQPVPAPRSAPAGGPVDAATPRRQRTPVPPPVIVAVVAVFSLVAVGLLAVVVPRPAPRGAVAESPSASGQGTQSAAAASQAAAASSTPVGDQTISGQGPGTAEFAFADSTGLVTITNEGTGPFSVWTVAADGSRQAEIVKRDGAYVGTRRFAAADGRVVFEVESGGAWSIEVKPFLHARTWNRLSPLIGDGDDVVLLFPQPDGDVRLTVISDGAIAVAAYAGGSKHDVVDESGPFRGELVLPAGTSVLEIASDEGWSMRPA